MLFLFGPILVSPSAPASADDIERVMITNFPSVQSVDGTMAIGSPIPSTRLLEVSTVVSPADPRDRVYLYNSGKSSVSATLYLYLSA